MNKWPEWQPIETAPKSTSLDVVIGGRRIGSHVTGAYILGYCPDEGTDPISCISVVWWEPHQDGGVWWGEGGFRMRPTHWMPLPEPPKDTE